VRVERGAARGGLVEPAAAQRDDPPPLGYGSDQEPSAPTGSSS
jgi:hypothetical protein